MLEPFGPGGLAGHEMIATTVARNPNPVGLQLLVDAQPHCQIFDGRFRLDLPPLAASTKAPIAACHDFYSERLAESSQGDVPPKGGSTTWADLSSPRWGTV